jgi:hypothetical protein
MKFLFEKQEIGSAGLAFQNAQQWQRYLFAVSLIVRKKESLAAGRNVIQVDDSGVHLKAHHCQKWKGAT